VCVTASVALYTVYEVTYLELEEFFFDLRILHHSQFIFSSSISEIWFIRSMFDLEAIGVMFERRQSNFISRFRCSVSFADAILCCM